MGNPLLDTGNAAGKLKHQRKMDAERLASTFDVSECAQPAFRKLMALMSKKRDAYRVDNDTPQPEEKTAELRGRIAMLNDMLALDKPTQLPGDEQ